MTVAKEKGGAAMVQMVTDQKDGTVGSWMRCGRDNEVCVTFFFFCDHTRVDSVLGTPPPRKANDVMPENIHFFLVCGRGYKS